jgi:murein DD-endopeptidase MepM/ murein hydrolase activator NlpD
MNKKIPVHLKICGIVLLFLIYQSCKNNPDDHKTEVDTEWIENREHIYAFGICIDSFDLTGYVIEAGKNPSTIFSGLGFSPRMVDSLNKAVGNVLDPRKLRAGTNYYTVTSSDSVAEIKYIIFSKSFTDFSIIDLTTDNIRTYEYFKEVRLERKYLEGTINSSLWNNIQQGGNDPLLALKISDILAWQIDFFDVKDGDSYRVMYDVAYIDDTVELFISSVEGLVFTHQGKEFTAIPFRQDSVTNYYDREGNSLKKSFLKAPLDFFRITSKFTNARFHPILKRYRPHHGIDYAAPTGTPVKAIGAGTVIAKGYESGGGNYLKIKHNSVYTTSYMHLSRFGKGIATGSFVNQGAVIGYVGSTGLSTGPHLDFRVYKNGEPVNPLTMESPPGDPIKPILKDSFETVKRNVFAEMDSLHQTIEICHFETLQEFRQ